MIIDYVHYGSWYFVVIINCGFFKGHLKSDKEFKKQK